MKDIPVFTTENGVASLTLAQIPYRGEAYIRLQSSQEPALFLRECAQFLRACGALAVYATGEDVPPHWPVYTALWQMSVPTEALPDTDVALWPVLPENLEQWLRIYREKVAKVPTGAWMTEAQGREMLKKGEGYFIHRNGQLLGIGRIGGDTLHFVASVSPGAGADVVAALAHATGEPLLQLTVASANEKAWKLYERLGFCRTREICKWYCIE